MRLVYASVLFFALALPGCVAPELGRDGAKLRDNLVELNTNQVMDNLIRASHGLPIIQIDYSCSAQITVEQTAMGMENSAVTNMSMVARAAAKTVTVLRTAVNTVTGGLMASHQNQVSMSGSPVLTSDGVYDAYLAYLGLDGSLCVSPDRPCPECFVLCRKYKKEYYWIPIEFKDQFYDLAMIATTQRDRILLDPDPYVLVTVKQIVEKRGKAFVVKTDRTLSSADRGTGEFSTGTLADVIADEPNLEATLYVGNQKGNNQLIITPLGGALVHLQEGMVFKLRGTDPPAPTTKELLDRMQFSVPQAAFINLPAAAKSATPPAKFGTPTATK